MATATRRSIELAERHAAHNYHPLPVVVARARGCWVWDADGRRYLDMLSAYSALNQGHRHPAIIRALRAQAGRVTLTSRAFHNDRLGPFCRTLCRLSRMDRVLLMNTGAEAVETAIKCARKWGYKRRGVPEGEAEVVVFENNFHGRTTTIVGFSSEAQYRDGFGPFTPGFRLVPYGDLEAARRAVGPRTVAVLVEPVQGEAGIVIPPRGFLRGLRALCDEAGALLVADEIQTGFGRTGRLFACEHEGVRPDVLVVGKALGGGVLPVSGVLASDEVMGVFTPGDHGSTFGGNPLACAVGEAAVEALVKGRMVQNSARQGAWFLKRLAAIPSPHVKEVRGLGLFIGVEIRVSSGTARPYCERLMEKGLLCKETHHQVIRFAPPLIITRRELEWAMSRIEPVLLEGV
ncbi:MAG: ornithine--oxo-acid transaminase [Planctomycetes bacterium]|nr:ornithine--oxo-acid transaminase [Planctomycetota bacterium]